VPIVYQLLKSVGHSTMALTEIVTPYLDNPDNQSWRGAMSAYRARMKAAVDGLDATPMPADWRDNSRVILENNIAFMDDCLTKGSISSAALQEFAKKQSPLLKRNIDRSVGALFFGNYYLMDYELMGGNARAAIIAEDEKRGMKPFPPPAVPFGSQQ
jgi:hypothetical protein